MAAINPLTREVVFKIVFYGPGLGGKTTSLQHIHDASSPDNRGKMVSLATAVDRTLYFDFLPLRLPTVRGMGIRLQLFTVPGQVHYAATRKLVVTGADGVVFVADSQESRTDANIDSLDDLRQNLREQQRDPALVPLVFQLNKRDLPGIVPMAELAAALTVGDSPVVASVATTGQGVFETLELVTKAVIRAFERGLPPNPSSDPRVMSEERGIEHALRHARLEDASPAAAIAPAASRELADDEATPDPGRREAGSSRSAPVSADVSASAPRGASPPPPRREATPPPPRREPTPPPGARVPTPPPDRAPAPTPPRVPTPPPGEASLPISYGIAERGPPSSPSHWRRPSAPALDSSAQETSWPAPVSETPTITPVPALGFSLAELWPEGERELIREAEAAISIRDLERAVELLDRVATRAMASTVASLGATDSPRDPLVALGLLGVDGRRYLAFRALVRDIRAGAKISDRLALGAYAFLLELRSARARIGL